MINTEPFAVEQRMLDGRPFSLRRNFSNILTSDRPLIVAIHGGGYSSAYFDIPGLSLLGCAAVLDIPVLALDRVGYGNTAVQDPSDLTHAGQAAAIEAAIGMIWAEHGTSNPGIVLVGHSIGAAIALMIAASRPAWPLLGVAVSGVGLKTGPGDLERWTALPPVPFIDVPLALKDSKMFGPGGTFEPDAPERSHAASVPAARAELIDIVTAWPRDVTNILGKILVPLHYRQGDHDALFVVDENEVAVFAAAASSAVSVDAAIVPNAGHCIDYHRIGLSFQLEQLSFALRCGLSTRL